MKLPLVPCFVSLLVVALCFGAGAEPAAPASDGTLAALTSIAGNGIQQDGMFKSSGLWPFGDIADKDEKDATKAGGQ